MRQNRNYAIRLQDISEALIACGYTKLDKQAKALGGSSQHRLDYRKGQTQVGTAVLQNDQSHSRKSRTSTIRSLRRSAVHGRKVRCVGPAG